MSINIKWYLSMWILKPWFIKITVQGRIQKWLWTGSIPSTLYPPFPHSLSLLFPSPLPSLSSCYFYPCPCPFLSGSSSFILSQKQLLKMYVLVHFWTKVEACAVTKLDTALGLWNEVPYYITRMQLSVFIYPVRKLLCKFKLTDCVL